MSRSDPRCLFAIVDAPRAGGLYRSVDAGESWERVNGDPRRAAVYAAIMETDRLADVRATNLAMLGESAKPRAASAAKV